MNKILILTLCCLAHGLKAQDTKAPFCQPYSDSEALSILFLQFCYDLSRRFSEVRFLLKSEQLSGSNLSFK